MGMKTNLSKETRTILKQLVMEGSITEDGTWLERFLDRLLDQETAAQAAREAVRDEEALDTSAIVAALWVIQEMPRGAFIAALREAWLDFGLKADPESLAAIFHDARLHEEVLMTREELKRLHELPDAIVVYRGQFYVDGPTCPTGHGWTLVKEVAGWYAAPVPALGQPHGWVLSTTVQKNAVLALFLTRGESEVVIDLEAIHGVSIQSERGTCNKFPKHLSCRQPATATFS